jgi:uncharacterized protein YqeY
MLKDKIQDDLKQSMLARDEFRTSAIRMLKSAIQYYEIQKGGAGYEASDDDVIDVIGKEVKKRKESIELYKQGGREEAANNEQRELEILQDYLPEQMSEDEIREIRTLVNTAVKETGAKTIQEMGKVMAVLMPKVKGKADGNMVSNMVREELTK